MPLNIKLSLAILMVLSLTSLTSLAQTLSTQRNGTTVDGLLGFGLVNAGDVNGDGIDDLLTNIRGGTSGTVEVLSGIDLSVLFTDTQPTPTLVPPGGLPIVTTYGFSKCGVGDQDGDGSDDFAMALSNSLLGSVRVHSGATGALLTTLTSGSFNDSFGQLIAPVGDINSDGRTDLAVLALDPLNGMSSLSIYDPLSTTPILVITNANFLWVRNIAALGDVNNDGVDDFVVGPTNPFPSTQAGQIQVISGADGSVLRTTNGIAVGDQFGSSLTSIADLNGDGVREIVVGSPFHDGGMIDSGRVDVLSGADGSNLHTVLGTNPNALFGFFVAEGRDANNDGAADFAVEAPGSTLARVRVFSGSNATELFTLVGPNPPDQLGVSFASLGDTNGDGLADFAVGAPGVDIGASNGGAVLLYHSPSQLVQSYVTTTGAPHFLQQTWLPTGGNPSATTGTIEVTGATPAGAGLVYASLMPDDTLLFGFLPVLVDGTPSQVTLIEAFGYDAAGIFTSGLVNLTNPALAGQFLYCQFYQSSPFVFSSNGLRFLIQ